MKTIASKSFSRQLAAILFALCICVGDVAATTTPAYAASSIADTGGTYYVSAPGYLFPGLVSANKTMTLKWKGRQRSQWISAANVQV